MTTWKEASEGNFPVYPSGKYLVKVTSVKRKTSAKKMTPGIQFIATVLSPVDYTGRFLSVDVWKNAEFRAVQLVEACGITGVPDNLSVDIGNEAFFNVCKATEGCTTIWCNTQTEYEGKPKNDITDFELNSDQAVIEFSIENDAPEWAKG